MGAGLLLAALATAANAGGREEVLAADRAFSALSVEKGAAFAFWSYSGKTTRQYGTSGPPKIGRAATAPAAKKDMDVLSWAPTAAGADGHLGWSDGVWKLSGPNGADTGHYVTVWMKEGGAWRMQADIGTTDPRPAPARNKP